MIHHKESKRIPPHCGLLANQCIGRPSSHLHHLAFRPQRNLSEIVSGSSIWSAWSGLACRAHVGPPNNVFFFFLKNQFGREDFLILVWKHRCGSPTKVADRVGDLSSNPYSPTKDVLFFTVTRPNPKALKKPQRWQHAEGIGKVGKHDSAIAPHVVLFVDEASQAVTIDSMSALYSGAAIDQVFLMSLELLHWRQLVGVHKWLPAPGLKYVIDATFAATEMDGLDEDQRQSQPGLLKRLLEQCDWETKTSIVDMSGPGQEAARQLLDIYEAAGLINVNMPDPDRASETCVTILLAGRTLFKVGIELREPSLALLPRSWDITETTTVWELLMMLERESFRFLLSRKPRRRGSDTPILPYKRGL